MYPVELNLKVRQHCLTDGNSERQTAKEFGISRNSVRKMLMHPKPPGYQRKTPISQPAKDHFARPGKGNDKGKVEGVVGFSRRNFMVPVPSFDSFEDLNAHLQKCCEERQQNILRGHNTSIKERFALDQEALSPLPERPYDPSVVSSARVSSTSLVRYKETDYSVPVRYGYQDVFVKAYVAQPLPAESW